MVNFTDRELQVLKRVHWQGWGTQRTAKDLNLTNTRIRQLRKQVLVKLQQIT